MPNFQDVYKRRAYCHFDFSIASEFAQALATNPFRVARHSFHPFIRREVKRLKYHKKKGRTQKPSRFLCYASHADSAIYSWYGALLAEKYEKRLVSLGLSSAPIAYRKFPDKRCNIHFAQNAFQFIQQNRPCVAFCFDVTGFFDNLCHEQLLTCWKDLLGEHRLPDDHWAVYKSLIRYSWIDESFLFEKFPQIKKRLYKHQTWPTKLHKHSGKPSRIESYHDSQKRNRLCTPKEFRNLRKEGAIQTHRKSHGIPQGSPMSAILSNVYMMNFDRSMSNYAEAVKGYYRRYSDDIFLIVPVQHKDSANITVRKAIEKCKLEVQSAKTEIVEFGKTGLVKGTSLQYLGLTFDGISTRLRCSTLMRARNKVNFYLSKSQRVAQRNISNPQIHTSRFHLRFSNHGKRNFLSYGKRCVTMFGCSTLRAQVNQHAKRNLRSLRKHRQ